MIGFEEVTGFLIAAVSHPVDFGWVVFGVILLLVILYSAKHFLDIALDIWKIPFAIIIDAVDLLSYNNGYYDLAAAISGFVLFWVFARRGHHLSKLFALVVAVETLVGVWFFPEYAFITNLLPLATILMFVSVWSD